MVFLLYWELCFKVIYESETVQFAEKEDNITVYKKVIWIPTMI